MNSKFLKSLRPIKIIGIILLIPIIFLLIFLWVRSDQGQQYILKRTTAYLSSKTNTTIKIDYLYLSWVGDLVAKGIYLEDLQQDTLVYAEHVNVNLDLWSLIRKKTIDIEYIIGRDVRLNVDRSSVSGEFNYQFIMDAFTSSDSGKSKSIPLSFQKISMDKIRIASNDAIQGINYLVKLEDLDLEMKKMNISKREYEVDLLSLNDGAFIYNKYGTKSEVDEINVPDNSINHIAINQAEIINIAADYTSAVDGLEIKSFLPQSLFESINISPEDNYISAQSVILSSGELNYHDMNSNSSDKSGLLTQSDSSIGLDWKLDIDNLKLIENNLAFRRGDAVGVKGIFNPNDVILQELNLDSRKLFISKSEGSGQLLSLSVKERSGFNISNLTSDVEFDNDNLAIQNLQIKTGHNRLKGEVHIFYKSLNEFMSNPELVQFDVNFPDVLLNPKDVFYFNPDWRKNPKISKLVENNIKGNVYVKGFFNEMEVINSNLSWGRFDKLGVSGFVSNITSKKSPIQFDLDKVNVKMTRSTVMHLLDTDSLKFNLPKDILLDGKIKGNIDHIFSDIRLVSNEGKIGFIGGLGYQNNNITIDGHADFDNVNLKHFLDNEQLGIVSGSGEISMQGSELYNLVANISANIDEIDFHDYRYNHIRLDTELQDGIGNMNFTFADVNFSGLGTVALDIDSIENIIETNFRITKIDLLALGISKDSLIAQINMNASLKGNRNQFTISATATDGEIVQSRKNYSLKGLSAYIQTNEASTTTTLNTDFLDAKIQANTHLISLYEAIERKVNYHLHNVAYVDSLGNAIMTAHINLKEVPIVAPFIVPGLQKANVLTADVDFAESENRLNAKINGSAILVQDHLIDSLYVDINADRDSAKFRSDLFNITSPTVDIMRVEVDGNYMGQSLNLKLTVSDELGDIVNIGSQARFEENACIIRFLPKNFILNRSNWSIPNDNAIHWRNDRIDFREFTVTRNEQSISIEDFYANDKWDNINVIFKDFNLNTFSSLINNEKLIAEGLANGIFRIYNINETPGFVADLKVRELVAMDVSLGTLDLVGEVGEEDQYKLKAALSGSNVDVTLDGIYMPRADYEQLNFNLVYNKLDFQSFEILFSKYLNDISGLISGSARVYGNVASPKYKGSINFEKTQFKIKALESTFILPDESVLFSDRKVDLNNLTVWDTDGNDFQINGDISLSNYLNPAFQLTIDGRDLQLLNTKAGHNDKYYGIVYADTKLTVNGTLQDPIIRGDIRINENSDFTYIVPESAIEVQERNGIVLFVNKDDEDQDMVNNIHKLQTKKVLGLDVYTTIQIHPKSTLNIIIDRRTDDRLQVSGEGDLNFRIETNGQATIFGRYDVAQGFYSASLYNLVKRRFDLVPGSNIIWKGDPLDIDMNIQAIYEVEADAREMMALNLGYSTSENRDEISQKVPLQIYLQLNGSLIQPRLSFRLDISEEHKGDLNGRLYNQILSLNQREDELNKQVFSLLVFNQLFPTGSNDGSGGGYLNLARDNMNKLLESQLNKFSDKIFGKAGIELGFNLNRYMDYQNDKLKSTTQLDIKAKKRFLDNRLSIEVSSGINVKTGSQILQSTPAVGNVSLEYILTDDGKLRIKGFRKSQYDNIIDGQLYVIGIALVFQREFEKFKNLWQKTLLVNEIGTKNDDR